MYYYEKNLQGDVVAVYNSSGTKLISYAYSAWGETTTTYHNGGASTTAINNPYTYRGYYYDKDLGLYYLQSRYYDANICRFINPDKFVSTGQGLTGYNMFAYCGKLHIIKESLIQVLTKMMRVGYWDFWKRGINEWLKASK